MSLDEFLFGKISNYLRDRKYKKNQTASCVRLSDISEKLLLVARAISGMPISIFEAEKEGGYKDNAFFLPQSVCFFDDAEWNLRFYIFRILFLCEQKKQRLNWITNSEIPSTEVAYTAALQNSNTVLSVLFEEYTVVKDWFDYFTLQFYTHHPTINAERWLYGKYMTNTLDISQTKAFHATEDYSSQLNNSISSTLKVKAVEEIIRLEVDKKQQEDYVLTHNFEKVETADEFNGVWRDFDGDDELKAHQRALDELNMKFTVRVNDQVHSVYQADFVENSSISESAEIQSAEAISYPEWDFRHNSYRKDYCKVFHNNVIGSSTKYYSDIISSYSAQLLLIKKHLANIQNKRNQIRRQSDGDSFDLDALTNLYVDVHSGKTPSEKIYNSHRKNTKDISILLLLDNSLSSDGYSKGNRIIDVEKQVSILFGEVLNEYAIDFSIAAFHSVTRNNVQYQQAKGFDEEWSAAKYKIGSIQPHGYTRIGGAIRHATNLLKNRPTKNKWILLITDGKPNDYDKYEGKYGIQDVRQALHELGEYSIYPYALAIEANAKYYLPQMFGQNRFQILSSTNELVYALFHLIERIRSTN